ncbi:WYL domain-containing protein [Paracrocinitomix mangrovi]|uniref:helix-turn-helix transcriptional regulator n=1 Tax=Paracrocinitomix mangrovi TaxID=2862509 RepID=UPI001C8DEBEA|nr:WYL domain-containing protein [Paracrocinitomix mangrovi]UKN01509.1 WYL domain-containing protein [Paracrocinitomix mangrovi]
MSKIKNAQLRYRVIDRCLRNPYNPYPTKEDLRQACEEALFGSSEGVDICDSTIEKDMFAMRMDFDAPIKYSKKEKGYYYEDEQFSIDKIPLTEGDIDAIKFATNTLMQFREVGIFKQFGFAIDKIFDRVHISSNPLDDSIDNHVQFETQAATKGNDMLPDLLKAIKEKLIVKFNYTSFATGKTKEREVLPLLLKEYRNRWYLISYVRSKSKVITFGLDRMSDLIITEEYFKDDFDFNPDLFFKYSIGITANDSQPQKVELKIDKVGSKYLQSQPLHDSQTLIKEGKRRDTFQLEVLISEELKREILSYGSQMEVISPLELRNEIAIKVQEMVDIYG